ncbi:MAG: DNA mismatch endonuclease Vsr [Candidatus Hydrogenedentes bacterium]|nr:DNA mismatch endonuclease Vsr [Candidatus Hydrogenedentota bacterium]
MDRISPRRRSANMRAIRSKGTKPELEVRRLVYAMGYRYRLHARDLPGKPDLVFRKKSKAIFVHGCFWHQHPSSKCRDARLPKSRQDYWHKKLWQNVARDKTNIRRLRRSGWSVLVVWECQLRHPATLALRLAAFLA